MMEVCLERRFTELMKQWAREDAQASFEEMTLKKGIIPTEKEMTEMAVVSFEKRIALICSVETTDDTHKSHEQ
jgi:hypothetical protein